MAESIRKRISFNPQRKVDWRDSSVKSIQNIIHVAGSPDEHWIAETTEKIGDWRNIARSVYIRWAITINAMEVSQNYYKKLSPETALETKAMRVKDGVPCLVNMATWTGAEASENYQIAQQPISAYAFTDMYGVIEDIIFDSYGIFLENNPLTILKGTDFKAQRKLFHSRNKKPDEWQEAWRIRYNSWRKKRLYDGLSAVMKAYWNSAGLKEPSNYKMTDIKDWAGTIFMFGELRNHIVHSAQYVSEKLENACEIKGSMNFSFKSEELLEVDLFHLMAIECFIDQYLTALNLALIEMVRGEA